MSVSLIQGDYPKDSKQVVSLNLLHLVTIDWLCILFLGDEVYAQWQCKPFISFSHFPMTTESRRTVNNAQHRDGIFNKTVLLQVLI